MIRFLSNVNPFSIDSGSIFSRYKVINIINIVALTTVFFSFPCIPQHSHEQDFKRINHFIEIGALDSALSIIYEISEHEHCADAVNQARVEFYRIYELSAQRIFNQAVSHYNKGELHIAKALLHDITQGYKSTKVQPLAKALLDKIEDMSKKTFSKKVNPI